MHEMCHILGMVHTHQIGSLKNPCDPNLWTAFARDGSDFQSNYVRVMSYHSEM